ncbi:shikimate dehydrogenase [candidate division WOR-1 bacterium RIFOXYB2_FULL_48_7]|uniref:Shikimate dehydrogenase (NADP(+)) n=1 Tax=candidate division WOR-1 bacterium RIFOXYB2_FULL_48_7 TaxID=1802583 RepID=A0A1F4TMF2_UNCSA|nr:MAG: shikimate dehydrogenase [candidate division WOR-1 bacterium RIFOXYB2_FULL_48_7]
MKKIVGLLGYPLGHTVSPAMHNAAYKQLGLNFEYVPFEVEPKELKEAVNGLRAMHIAGFNVTVPHKEAIVAILDEVTELARIIGAVNTVENQEGKLVGYNTDAPGFLDSLREDYNFEPRGKRVVILGAGGASRAVATILAEVKAKSLTIGDTIEPKAAALAEYLSSYLDIKCSAVEMNSPALQKALDNADLLVNATPIGMHPNVKALPLDQKMKLNKNCFVYDLVYNPAETALLQLAKDSGCQIASGLGMLVRQGAQAFEIFTGEEAPIETMFAAAQNALRVK